MKKIPYNYKIIEYQELLKSIQTAGIMPEIRIRIFTTGE